MPSKKRRPYVPKTKGCYPCSRRRIHCDRTEPRCRKCISKGLTCTGLGLRVRFSYVEPQSDNFETLQASIGTLGSSSREAGSSVSESSPEDVTLYDQQSSEVVNQRCHQIHHVNTDLEAETSKGQPNEPPRRESSLVPAEFLPLSGAQLNQIEVLRNAIPNVVQESISSWKRWLCHHFSGHIATEMIAVDGAHNGWRSVVLPLAQRDALVMQAVLAVSSSHIWLNHNDQQTVPTIPHLGGNSACLVPNPNVLYKEVISGLQQESNFGTTDLRRKESVLVTLLVLIVGVMVTGQSDFPAVFNMLDSALSAMGGEQAIKTSSAVGFIVTQINKFRLYAAPMISEEHGLQVISSPGCATRLCECLVDQLPKLPEYNLVVSFVRDLNQQAINIYLDQHQSSNYPYNSQLSTTQLTKSSVTRIQHFMETLQAFPHGHQGEQVLIWATFLAASSCVLDEQREYFEGVFMQHYIRNGFANISDGLAHLRDIWSRSPDEKWTSLLAQARTLVM